jgi:hypothetical protein
VVKLFETDPNFKVAVGQLPRAKFQEYARIGILKGDDIIMKALQRVLVTNEPVATVLKETAADLDKELRPVRDLVKKAQTY